MFKKSDAIEILLKEYDTLRAELVMRSAGTFQLAALVGVLVSVTVNWLGTGKRGWPFWTFLFLCLLAVIGFLSFLRREINNVSHRVQEIETHINELAGVKLLCWESRCAAAKRGHGFRKSLPPDETGRPVETSNSWSLPE